MPSADRMTAIPRRLSNFAQTIANITMIGTDRNMPGMPHNRPQKVSDRRIINELRLSDFPIRAGSTRFPMVNCTAPRPNAMKKNGVRVSNCTRVSKAGNITPRMDRNPAELTVKSRLDSAG